MEYAPRRITVPEEYEEKEPVLVMKHHLDTNHHVNNAQYVEIVREFLPEHFQIGEMRVEYKKAACWESDVPKDQQDHGGLCSFLM